MTNDFGTLGFHLTLICLQVLYMWLVMLPCSKFCMISQGVWVFSGYSDFDFENSSMQPHQEYRTQTTQIPCLPAFKALTKVRVPGATRLSGIWTLLCSNVVFIMDKCLPQSSSNWTLFGFKTARPLLPVTPFLNQSCVLQRWHCMSQLSVLITGNQTTKVGLFLPTKPHTNKNVLYWQESHRALESDQRHRFSP